MKPNEMISACEGVNKRLFLHIAQMKLTSELLRLEARDLVEALDGDSPQEMRDQICDLEGDLERERVDRHEAEEELRTALEEITTLT